MVNSTCGAPESRRVPEEMGALMVWSWAATERSPALPTWTEMVLRCASMAVSWATAIPAIARIAQVSSGLIRINPPQIVLKKGRGKEAGDRPAPRDGRAILPLSDVAHE